MMAICWWCIDGWGERVSWVFDIYGEMVADDLFDSSLSTPFYQALVRRSVSSCLLLRCGYNRTRRIKMSSKLCRRNGMSIFSVPNDSSVVVWE